MKRDITLADLLYRGDHVIRNEIGVTNHQLRRNGVEVLPADAAFTEPHTVRLTYTDGRGHHDLSAIVISVGTKTTRDGTVTIDGQSVFTSDDVLELRDLPRSLTVIGAGASDSNTRPPSRRSASASP